MTELEFFLSMLTRAGINFEKRASKNPDYDWLVTVEADTPNVEGCIGFFTDFRFKDGNLVVMGVWE